MIKTLILKYIASNLDHLVSFLSSLDKHLDDYIAKQNAKADVIQTDIDKKQTEKAQVQKQAETAASLRLGVRQITG